MSNLTERADLHQFFAKELELIELKKSIPDCITSFQSWMCNYLSLLGDSAERDAFVSQVDKELHEIYLVHKYKNIYGQPVHCAEKCNHFLQALRDYIRVKYGQVAA